MVLNMLLVGVALVLEILHQLQLVGHGEVELLEHLPLPPYLHSPLPGVVLVLEIWRRFPFRQVWSIFRHLEGAVLWGQHQVGDGDRADGAVSGSAFCAVPPPS